METEISDALWARVAREGLCFLLQVMLCLLEAKLWDMWAGFDRVEDLLVIPANGFKTLTVSRL